MVSALRNIGTASLLTFLPMRSRTPMSTPRWASKTPMARATASSASMTTASPLSLCLQNACRSFRRPHQLLQGEERILKNDATLTNYNRNIPERFQHIQVVQGKQLIEVGDLRAGDIGAHRQAEGNDTGETLGDKASPFFYSPAQLPEPSITFAIEPKTRADEDKIGVSIHKILEEDPALRFSRDPQTKEFLLAGSGQQHIEVVVAKLHKRYHVDLTLKPPKVPYRETIRGKADVEGKHKKQSGGHGQFGVCRIKMEPVERGKGVEFVDDVFGGAIPKKLDSPPSRKASAMPLARGFLAGFPVVDFRAILYDGKYHDVDSSDMAFKIAGSLAFKETMKQARPALLEPVMHVEVYAPDQYSGT